MASQSESVCVGLDGGATKTKTVCVVSGKVVGRAVTPASNFNSVGQDASKASVIGGISQSLKEAQVSPSDVDSICVGMAGIGRPSDIEMVKGWLSEYFREAKCQKNLHVYNDSVPALVSGTDGKLFGVVVISGTGTIAVGYNEEGDSCRAGGWGPLLGDRGSGYDIGAAALKSVVMSVDGTGPETSLKKGILGYLSLSSTDELVTWTYQDTSWHRIADLSRVVFSHSDSDKESRRIIEEAIEGILLNVCSIVKRLQMKDSPFQLVLNGGNFTHENSVFLKCFREILEREKERYPDLQKAVITLPSMEPEIGAAKLAARLI
eukprot:CAMPEP_0201490958 /NCGR_PEP_ID=MMETSP0151_2-20130828/28079_1 /ASSEMBLY_ACC=CAM_ASM_000257 /TAXON_ID=200890 /ORGANISM="Paramoeba atlantica, Strain 621/1 / CCAP 1560/9" /LENGTH=319 /DNA_ID=CAMNT_0047877117 /DNA_START=14 /DNA_END=973 /DNA_ORIENTATION=+